MKNNSKKLSIGLLIALAGFPQISETIYTPALPSVAMGLLASAQMAEATLAIYFLGFALGVLLWGTISDFLGRRTVMLTGLLIYAAGTLGCANAGSVEALLGWRFLQAFGASVGSVITQTILREAYDGIQRAKLFSIMSGALAFSPAVGPLLGGFISEYWGWRANFWILVALALILIIWSFFSLPETRPKRPTYLSISELSVLFIAMMSSRFLWGHILLIAASAGVLFGFYQEAPFVFIEQLGIKPSHYGCFGLLIAASTLFAARLSYRKGDRFSAEFMIQCGAVCVMIGGVALTLIVMTGIFNLSALGIALAILALFFVFFGVGLIIPNSLSGALKAYATAVGTAGSIFGGCYYCLIAGCAWSMSLIHNGTALPLPLYIASLGLTLIIGGKMIQSPAIESQKITG